MARSTRKTFRIERSFVILVMVVALGGAILWSSGDLISPLQSTELMLGMSGDPGFAMVGEGGARPERTTETTETQDAEPSEAAITTDASAETTAAVETMTMDAFLVELAANGVDVDAVSAQMSAEGRSLDNLLAVVNSGRVTVAELATRLQPAAVEASDAETSPSESGVNTEAPIENGSGLFDIRWDEIGSVAYDLWMMLAVTVVVIVVARPVGWLVKRLPQSRQPRRKPTQAHRTTLNVSNSI